MLFFVFITSGLFLGWSLGSNDAANIFGSAVGSKMISFRKAAIIASIFVVIGAVFQGQGGAETLNALGAVDALGGAFTVSLCAGLIVFFMTRRSLPVSTSQAIVGAIIGWSFFTGNPTDYSVLGKIVGTWVSGPLLGMLFAAGMFVALRWALRKSSIHVITLDQVIRISLVMAGAFGAYSLGANNIANVMGVFVKSAPAISLNFGLFTLDGVQILFLLGGLAIALGIFTYSERVMNTVGNGILALNPEAAIVVVLSQALVLFVFSSRSLAEFMVSIGLPPLPLVPVSSTQVVIGSLMGIGLVKGVREIKIKALASVFLGWILTPLASGILTYFALFVVQNVFNIQVALTKAEAMTEVVEPVDISKTVESINMVLPAALLLSFALLAVFVFLMIRQQRLRMKTENKLLAEQNQSFVAQKTLAELELTTIQKENELLTNKLASRRNELTNMALNIAEQRSFVADLAGRLDRIIAEDISEKKQQRLKELSMLLRQKMTFSEETKELYGKIELLQKDFNLKLNSEFPDLTETEKRLATLLRLNISNKEIASLMNITPKSVEIARYRLSKKLGLSSGRKLNQYLAKL